MRAIPDLSTLVPYPVFYGGSFCFVSFRFVFVSVADCVRHRCNCAPPPTTFLLRPSPSHHSRASRRDCCFCCFPEARVSGWVFRELPNHHHHHHPAFRFLGWLLQQSVASHRIVSRWQDSSPRCHLVLTRPRGYLTTRSCLVSQTKSCTG